VPIKGKSELVFNSDPPKTLINYAEAIEQDGYLDDKAATAWIRAHKAWLAYGDRDIPSSYGYRIRLNDGERWGTRAQQLAAELDELLPGVRDRLRAERMAKLSEKERQLLAQPRTQWGDDYDIGVAAADRTAVTHYDVASAAPKDLSLEARRLATRVDEAEAMTTTIRRYRDVVNFIYWRTRCEVEQTDTAIKARKYLYEAGEAYDQADLETAREKYEASWEQWAKIYDQHPELAEDTTADDLVDALKQYRRLLGDLDEAFPPPDFKLGKLLEIHKEEFQLPASVPTATDPHDHGHDLPDADSHADDDVQETEGDAVTEAERSEQDPRQVAPSPPQPVEASQD
jgi:hypothetical protein